MKLPILLLPICLIICLAPNASCATLQVTGDGLLSGAYGVTVSGKLYNVQFRDGTPRQVFNGADEAADFLFSDKATALAASSALLEQVFIDDLIPGKKFDTDYTLTVGLNNPYGSEFPFGDIVTPYAVSCDPILNQASVDATLARNGAEEGDPFATAWVDAVYLTGSTLDFNWQNDVWAVWTPIPEPRLTALICAIGLLGWYGVRGRLDGHLWTDSVVGGTEPSL